MREKKPLIDKPGNTQHKFVKTREYIFCPWCSARLVESEYDGKIRKRCPQCDFVHYKNPVPASGAIIEREGKVLMVKRKYPPRVDYWSIPAGFMEYGESPAACCIREVEEETGLKIKLTNLLKVYSGHDDPRTKAVLIVYLAEAIGGQLRAGDDASEIGFFSPENPPENLAFESHRRALADHVYLKAHNRLPDPDE